MHTIPFATIFEVQQQLAPEVLRRHDIDHARWDQAPVEGHVRLRSPPAWLVSIDMNLDGVITRTHTFCVVGDPGQGRRSGLAYYSMRSDEKRGGMTIDDKLLDSVREAVQAHELGPVVLKTLQRVAGHDYVSREAFYRAYEQERRDQDPLVTTETLFKEVKSVVFKLPVDARELWVRKPNGLRAPDGSPTSRPNMSEDDILAAEALAGKDVYTGKAWADLSNAEKQSGNLFRLDKVSIKYQPETDSLGLLDATSGLMLQRLYVDEMLDRNGTLMPVPPEHRERGTVPLTPERIRNTLAKLPTYTTYPPYSPSTGNCNSGLTTLLQLAGTPADKIRAASEFAYGTHHRPSTWDALGGQSVEPRAPGPDVDTTSASGRQIPTADIERARSIPPSEVPIVAGSHQLTPPHPGEGSTWVKSVEMINGHVSVRWSDSATSVVDG